MSLWLATSAVLGTLAVVAGAFGAHGLESRLTPAQLESWRTAAQYHLLHAVVLLALALYAGAAERSITLQGALFTGGIFLFSGSIYALCLGGPRVLGPVTPLGGLLLIAGWLSLLALARSPQG